MVFLKRFVGLIVVLLCVVGVAAALAGVAGVWVARQYLDSGAAKLFTRVESVLDVAHKGVRQVNEVLDRSEANLKEFRDEPPVAVKDQFKWLALKGVAVQLSSDPEARDNLATAAQAAVVANTVLQSVGGGPLDSTLDMNEDQVRSLSGRLTDAATLARQLDSMLGESPNGANPDAVRDQTSRVEAALETVRGVTGEFETRLNHYSELEQTLKSRVYVWLFVGAVVATAVLAWFVIAQISLLVHGWSWLTGRSASAAPAKE